MLSPFIKIKNLKITKIINIKKMSFVMSLWLKYMKTNIDAVNDPKQSSNTTKEIVLNRSSIINLPAY